MKSNRNLALAGAFVAFVVLVANAACMQQPLSESCPPPTVVMEAQDAGVTPPVDGRYELRYTLELDTADASVLLADLPTSIEFRSASGLEPYERPLPIDPKAAPDAGRLTGRGSSDLLLSGAVGTGPRTLRQWRQELGKVALCPDQGGVCDPELRWRGEAPPFLLNGAVVVRTTADDTWLARFHFHEAWPSAIAGMESADGGTSALAALTLVTRQGTVQYNVDHPLVTGLKVAYPRSRFDPLVLDLRADLKRLGSPVTGLDSFAAAIDDAWDAPPLAAIRAVGKHKGDYLPAHNFKLEIDGVISGGFKEVTGLESEIEVIEFKDGDDPITHKRAGKAKYKNITLKRGLLNDDRIYVETLGAPSAPAARKSGSVILLDRAGQEVLRYPFNQAFPTGYQIEPGSSDHHLVEEIEFVVEKVERG